MIELFKVLSDETRLRMLMLLKEEPLCVCQLVGILDVPQPRVSKNLAKFRDLDLVESVRKDKFIVYHLKADCHWLRQVLETVDTAVSTAPETYALYAEDVKRLSGRAQYLEKCTP